MILSGFVRETVAVVVREFGCTAASGELDSEIVQEGESVGVDAISWVSEAGGFRDAVLGASIVDGSELLG